MPFDYDISTNHDLLSDYENAIVTQQQGPTSERKDRIASMREVMMVRMDPTFKGRGGAEAGPEHFTQIIDLCVRYGFEGKETEIPTWLAERLAEGRVALGLVNAATVTPQIRTPRQPGVK